MNVTAPKFRFEWNINTIAVLVGFASGFVAWGYTLNEMKTGREINKQNIERIDVRMSSAEVALRQIDNHELRLTSVESQVRDGAVAMRSLDKTLGDLASDIKVTREILQRLEAAQKARFQP